jgi:hypothetical protein
VGAFPPSFLAGGASRAGALVADRPGVPFQPVLAGEMVTVTVSLAIPTGLVACTVKV